MQCKMQHATEHENLEMCGVPIFNYRDMRNTIVGKVNKWYLLLVWCNFNCLIEILV